MNRSGVNITVHDWVVERNRKRDSHLEMYVSLSELLAIRGCSLIGIYIYTNGGYSDSDVKEFKGFLQADALCAKRESFPSVKVNYYRLPIPSRLDGGQGRNALAYSLDKTVWDDLILRFELKSDSFPKEYLPPTWVAAACNNTILELYGDVIDYSHVRLSMPDIMNKDVSFSYGFSDWDEPLWKAMLDYLR